MAKIDYKDKYEKAVQAAMLAKQDTESAVTIGILEEIFPELREPEDEKIRKELLNAFQESEDSLYMVLTPQRRKSFIAFLEKLGEQKPAWSEEDERIIDTIISDLERHGGKEGSCYSTEINFLKSLKYRVQSQNLTITDEELINARNEAYNDALDKLEYHSDTPTFNDGWSAAIWYVKKRDIIQSQATWKPSDEQMKALREAVIEMGKSVSRCSIEEFHEIESLYNDLKKLKV